MEWKDIPSYEGIYQASTTGEIRSVDGKKTHSVRHGTRIWKGRVLKQKVSKDNSCRVILWKNKKERTWLVHRLVALTFIPKPEGKDYINHIDGSRLNNEISNLEWCDHTENNNQAFDNDLMTCNQKVILVDKNTSEPLLFRSLAKASLFLGHTKGYLSREVKKGHSEIKGYEVFLKAN
ncbi:NUMOD4 motif-containing HNH endonuclease [Bacillus toyonensis]|nr:NUMOD4 motif-containing HNH endonuclease [Bacillus toyonensis]